MTNLQSSFLTSDIFKTFQYSLQNVCPPDTRPQNVFDYSQISTKTFSQILNWFETPKNFTLWYLDPIQACIDLSLKIPQLESTHHLQIINIIENLIDLFEKKASEFGGYSLVPAQSKMGKGLPPYLYFYKAFSLKRVVLWAIESGKALSNEVRYSQFNESTDTSSSISSTAINSDYFVPKHPLNQQSIFNNPYEKMHLTPGFDLDTNYRKYTPNFNDISSQEFFIKDNSPKNNYNYPIKHQEKYNPDSTYNHRTHPTIQNQTTPTNSVFLNKIDSLLSIQNPNIDNGTPNHQYPKNPPAYNNSYQNFQTLKNGVFHNLVKNPSEIPEINNQPKDSHFVSENNNIQPRNLNFENFNSNQQYNLPTMNNIQNENIDNFEYIKNLFLEQPSKIQTQQTPINHSTKEELYVNKEINFNKQYIQPINVMDTQIRSSNDHRALKNLDTINYFNNNPLFYEKDVNLKSRDQNYSHTNFNQYIEHQNKTLPDNLFMDNYNILENRPQNNFILEGKNLQKDNSTPNFTFVLDNNNRTNFMETEQNIEFRNYNNNVVGSTNIPMEDVYNNTISKTRNTKSTINNALLSNYRNLEYNTKQTPIYIPNYEHEYNDYEGGSFQNHKKPKK
ncbi:hypothetical protein BB558_006665 [Smittium angustum]|uniref:Uncharacterized protein n=1 Tax=Smittium angustum TaxID=133377 RepID=A0A2U1IX73_SMIAN|nr:hypothetical protein BB558_006665 [Smittium angustum]